MLKHHFRSRERHVPSLSWGARFEAGLVKTTRCKPVWVKVFEGYGRRPTPPTSSFRRRPGPHDKVQIGSVIHSLRSGNPTTTVNMRVSIMPQLVVDGRLHGHDDGWERALDFWLVASSANNRHCSGKIQR